MSVILCFVCIGRSVDKAAWYGRLFDNRISRPIEERGLRQLDRENVQDSVLGVDGGRFLFLLGEVV